MGKIIMSEFVSLDGVIQDPDGHEGFRVGGWVGQIKDREELSTVKLGEALGTEALLLGRRSYEFFAARWQPRGGDLADRLNSLPKYVVSSTLQDPDWNNTTVIRSDVVNAVSTLKQEVAGDILVYASFQLLGTLIEHDLVDEMRLMVLPVVLGAGERLLGETGDKKPMRLVDTRTVDDDIAYLTYEPSEKPSYGTHRRRRDAHDIATTNETAAGLELGDHPPHCGRLLHGDAGRAGRRDRVAVHPPHIAGGISTLQWSVSAYTVAFGAGIRTVSAIVMPLGRTILTAAFAPEKRGAAVGIWGGIAGLAVASGPLVGGAYTGLDDVPDGLGVEGVAEHVPARVGLLQQPGSQRGRQSVPAGFVVKLG